MNTGTDGQQLPTVLAAVKAYTGSAVGQVLANAGYRSEAVMAELAKTQPETELVMALGREGKIFFMHPSQDASVWAPPTDMKWCLFLITEFPQLLNQSHRAIFDCATVKRHRA